MFFFYFITFFYNLLIHLPLFWFSRIPSRDVDHIADLWDDILIFPSFALSLYYFSASLSFSLLLFYFLWFPFSLTFASLLFLSLLLSHLLSIFFTILLFFFLYFTFCLSLYLSVFYSFSFFQKHRTGRFFFAKGSLEVQDILSLDESVGILPPGDWGPEFCLTYSIFCKLGSFFYL